MNDSKIIKTNVLNLSIKKSLHKKMSFSNFKHKKTIKSKELVIFATC